MFLAASIVVAFWIKFGWFWGLLALVAFLIDRLFEYTNE